MLLDFVRCSNSFDSTMLIIFNKKNTHTDKEPKIKKQKPKQKHFVYKSITPFCTLKEGTNRFKSDPLPMTVCILLRLVLVILNKD